MPETIGERLKHLREGKQLSLRQLATRAAVPVSTVSAVESGDRDGLGLQGSTLCRLAFVLGVSVDRLLAYDEATFHYELGLRQKPAVPA